MFNTATTSKLSSYKTVKACAVAVLATPLVVALGVGIANAASESKNVPAAEIVYGNTGIKSAAGEVKAGAAFGDSSQGAHGTFLKIPANFATPLHTHEADYYAIVIKGTVVNSQPGTKDVKMVAGSYWSQKGGEAHVTKCVSKTPCLTFFSQTAKFDFVPAK